MSNFVTDAFTTQFGSAKTLVENQLAKDDKRTTNSCAAPQGSSFDWFKNPSIITALDYYNRGLNVLPCRRASKKPAVSEWAHWQSTRQSKTDVARLFDRSFVCNIAIICGQASRCLYVVDCDDPGLFIEFCAEVERLYGPTWTVQSKRGGHIYFFASGPIRSRKYKGFEIKGQKNYVLAPGSVHPDGTLYEFRTKPEIILQLDRLPFCDLDFHDSSAAHDNSSHRVPNIQERLFSIACRYANKSNAYETRSEFDMAIIMAGVHIGAHIQDIRSVLNNAGLQTHYNRLLGEGRRDAAEQFLLFSHHKALQLGDSPEAKEAAAIAQCIRQWANERTWRGRGALSDKATLLAHVARCEQSSNPVFHLSCRDGSELAKVSSPTFAKSTNRLIQQGLLERVQVATGVNASCYRLHLSCEYTIPRNNKNVSFFNTSSSNKREEVLKNDTFPNSPAKCYSDDTETFGVFEHRVLGKAAEEVWFVLRRNWMIPSEISRRTGRSPNTVSRAIPKLLAQRIIVSELRGRRCVYSAVEDYDFEALSFILDSQQIGIERRNRHVAQRLIFRHQQTKKKMLRSPAGL